MLFCKVVWLGRPQTKSTWEPEHSLPQHLVADYNKGIQHDICHQSTTSGGQTIHSLSTARSNTAPSPPDPKRIRTDLIDTANSGYELEISKACILCLNLCQVCTAASGIYSLASSCGYLYAYHIMGRGQIHYPRNQNNCTMYVQWGIIGNVSEINGNMPGLC